MCVVLVSFFEGLDLFICLGFYLFVGFFLLVVFLLIFWGGWIGVCWKKREVEKCVK